MVRLSAAAGSTVFPIASRRGDAGDSTSPRRRGSFPSGEREPARAAALRTWTGSAPCAKCSPARNVSGTAKRGRNLSPTTKSTCNGREAVNVAEERKTQKARRQKSAIGNTNVVMNRDHLGEWLAHPWVKDGAIRLVLEGTAVIIEERTACGMRHVVAKILPPVGGGFPVVKAFRGRNFGQKPSIEGGSN